MDETVKQLIDNAKEKSMRDEVIDKATVIKLLSLDPESEECAYLGSAAREVTRVLCHNKGKIGSSIGIDLRPCKASCRFCGLGEKWGLVKEECYLSINEILALIRDRLAAGYYQFSLRTTEYFDLDELCRLAKIVRKEIPGNYFLTANTGELDETAVKKLVDAGFTGVYHTLRLREGVDTPFDPAVRIATLNAVTDSPLYLAVGLDPIGIEHTNEELADRLLFLRSINPSGICTMKRVNVKGTPMGDYEGVSDIRMAQIVAVVRLVASGRNVAIHPPIQKGMEWGANNAALETGADPRREQQHVGVWSDLGHDGTKQMFINAGYDMDVAPETRCR